MKATHTTLLSFLLLLLPVLAMGQVINDQADTVIQSLDTPETSPVSQSLRISGIRFGIDLQPWIRGLASQERTLYNAHLRVDVNQGNSLRFGMLLDYTDSRALLEGDSATYRNDGSTARIGAYLNVLPLDPDYNMVTIGLAYGRSWFNEGLEGVVSDRLYNDFNVSRSSTGLSAGWVEVVAGMQARIWKQFYAGYNLQLRLFPHFENSDQLQIYEIPGFGRASEKSSFGFSYYLLYRIPFGKRVPTEKVPLEIAK